VNLSNILFQEPARDVRGWYEGEIIQFSVQLIGEDKSSSAPFSPTDPSSKEKKGGGGKKDSGDSQIPGYVYSSFKIIWEIKRGINVIKWYEITYEKKDIKMENNVPFVIFEWDTSEIPSGYYSICARLETDKLKTEKAKSEDRSMALK